MRTGAGILPIIKVANKLFFLFGKERVCGKWSDFGGASDEGEALLDTAVREGYEETSGLLGSKQDISTATRLQCLTTIELDHYVSYVVSPIGMSMQDYATLPSFFKKNYQFSLENLAEGRECANGFFEKSEIKWFTAQEAFNNRMDFRPFYRPVLEVLLSNEASLIEKLILIERG